MFFEKTRICLSDLHFTNILLLGSWFKSCKSLVNTEIWERSLNAGFCYLEICKVDILL